MKLREFGETNMKKDQFTQQQGKKVKGKHNIVTVKNEGNGNFRKMQHGGLLFKALEFDKFII